MSIDPGPLSAHLPRRLLLVDPNPALTDAWEWWFAEDVRVEVVPGRFEDLPGWDCLVSPANSFGLMDGGVDLAISRFFGWDLQARAQQMILRDFFGEQPVGTSILVPTGRADRPWLAHTPTMRAPGPIAGTDAVYRATLAMLRAVATWNRAAQAAAAGPDAPTPIRVVACPGLGTGWGAVPPSSAAAQMAAAWRAAIDPPEQIDWRLATLREHTVDRAVASREPPPRP